jgi:hypothetical protein
VKGVKAMGRTPWRDMGAVYRHPFCGAALTGYPRWATMTGL